MVGDYVMKIDSRRLVHLVIEEKYKLSISGGAYFANNSLLFIVVEYVVIK